MSILEDIGDDSDQERPIAVMPLSRIAPECKIEIGEFVVFPAGSTDLGELGAIPNRTLEQVDDGSGVISIDGQVHREVCSDLTGFNIEGDLINRLDGIKNPLE